MGLFQLGTRFGVRRNAVGGGLKQLGNPEMTSSELRLGGANAAILWSQTHECGCARKHRMEPIMIDRVKKCRVARISNRVRGPSVCGRSASSGRSEDIAT